MNWKNAESLGKSRYALRQPKNDTANLASPSKDGFNQALV